MVTVLEGICGDGSSMDPMIIYKAEKLISEWFKGVSRANVPDNILFGRSPNRWTDERFAMGYLERHFGPGSLSERKCQESWRMLIFDGHTSHVNPRFLEYCIDHHIIPFCLPPHCTHRLQPLDVSVFSSYKHHYRRILQQRMEDGDYGVSKANFYSILLNARERAFTRSNIQSGFWWTGLIPVNMEIVLRQLPNPVERHNSPSIASQLALTPDRDECLLSPIPLDNLSPDQIDKLSTPHTLQELNNLQSTVLQAIPSNSPHSWRLRKAITKITHLAEDGLQHEKYNQERIQHLENERRERRHKKSQSRSQIPTQGRAWIDKEEIQQFFEKQVERKETEWKNRMERVERNVVRIRESLTILHQKRQEVEELESTKSLSKRRKTSAQLGIEEEALKLRLQKAQESLNALSKMDEGDNEEENEEDSTPCPVI